MNNSYSPTSPAIRTANRPPSCGPWLSIALVGLSLALPACHDQRITVAELNRREAELTNQPPVAVQPERLRLTDMLPYKVQVGDVLGVNLIGVLPANYMNTQLRVRVDSEGNIKLPIVEPLKVQGHTLAEVEKIITAAHTGPPGSSTDIVKDLTVFVELLDSEGTTVLVTGAVLRPGLLKLRANQRNVVYAVNEAGGYISLGGGGGGTAMAGGAGSSGRVVVRPLDPQRETVIYDLNNENDLRRAWQGPPLESGDVVMVEASSANVVYVTGVVNLPGAIPLPPGSQTSVVRAISAAGGFRPYIKPADGELIRMVGKDQVHVKLKLNDIMAGREADLALLPGDILRVPHNANTFMQEWVLQNLLVGPFNVSVRYDPLQQWNTDRALRQQGTQANSFSNAVRNALTTGLPQVLVPPVTPTAVP